MTALETMKFVAKANGQWVSVVYNGSVWAGAVVCGKKTNSVSLTI
jgi:hypothetical protein